MNTTFIANFIGKATPATIKQLAALTHENGGKWLISKVNFIEEQVAAVIKIEVPEENAQAVKEAFITQQGLVTQVVDSIGHRSDTICRLRLDSNDRAGIVNDITHVLDEQGVNILDMDCQRVFIASGAGVSSSLFTANMAIRLPQEVCINDITNELESLSEDIRVIIEP